MLHLTVWVVAIILQSVLLGRNMYAVSMGPHALACSPALAHTLIQAWCCVCPQLVCLTDLENDFINPFDLSSKMNRFVVSTATARGQHEASEAGWAQGGSPAGVLRLPAPDSHTNSISLIVLF